MPFDGGVIVGYLAAAVGKQVADRAIKALLDRLADRVSRRLGYGPLDTLSRQPDSPQVQAQLGRAIAQAAANDAAFARELSRMQGQLDRSGGRNYIGSIYVPYGTIAQGQGAMAVGHLSAHFRHPGDVSHAPGWAKGLIAIGFLVCLAGMGLFGYTMFNDLPDPGSPDFGGFPEGIKTAAAIFFAGFVISAIGSLVAGLTKHRS